jgi:hypothetical protein
MKVTIEVETEKPASVTIYLDEVLKTMERNEHFSISNYKIKTEK